ncbi:MAG: hypothetical protein H6R13_2518 [Proteobacteria bacterium]|nr:hypothetical protein [Pseudomonadota bacterium]
MKNGGESRRFFICGDEFPMPYFCKLKFFREFL